MRASTQIAVSKLIFKVFNADDSLVYFSVSSDVHLVCLTILTTLSMLAGKPVRKEYT